MKRILAILFATMIAFSGFIVILGLGNESVNASLPDPVEISGTHVSGPITNDTTWTTVGSPYIVTDVVVVKIDVTLTIEPSVIVKFNPGKRLQVDGSLRALGTPSEKIRFTSNSTVPVPGDWDTIKFTQNSNASDCLFAWCVIEYAQTGITVEGPGGGAVKVENATISRNQIGTYGKIKCFFSTISNNTGDGVYSFPPTYESPDIYYSTISDNGGNGFSGGAGATLYYTRIVSNNGSGIVSSGSFWVPIQYSEISYNKMDGINITTSSSGIMVSIENSTIAHNGGTGISVGGGAIIHYTNLCNNTGFAVRETYNDNIHAELNWWGTTDTNLIDQHIYDLNDDYNLGEVIYQPFLMGPIPSLKSVSLMPTSGDVFSHFNYTVIYSDLNNNIPSFVNVSIDETNYSMAPTDTSDTNYTDGKEYYYNTTFTIAGNHTYQFFTSNGFATSLTLQFSGPYVNPGPLDHILVTPNTATITADQTKQFTAIGYDEYNNIVSISPTWEATNGTITNTGLFYPYAVGDWKVYANQSSISGNATITVTPGSVHHIIVTPSTPTITSDQTKQFTAQGFDQYNNEVSITPTWECTNGTITTTGLFYPWSMGEWKIYANVSNVSGNATIIVIVGNFHHITVTPSPRPVPVTHTQQFAAEGYDQHNNLVTGLIFIWSVWNNIGTINTTTGLFTAGTIVRTGCVNATNNTITGSAIVTITSGALHHINITPEMVTITTDQIQQFSAAGYDVYNNTVSISPTWEINGGGIINSTTGLFTANVVGNWTIYANQSGISGNTTVTVTVGLLDHIIVLPDMWTLSLGESKQFTATGYDMDNNIRLINPVWETSGGGTINTTTGLFTADIVVGNGTWTIYANQSGITGTASITISINWTADPDNDGIPNGWEIDYVLDPLNTSDANDDVDDDGLTNIQEYLNGTKPNNGDSDGDQLGDGVEVIFYGTNPNNWDTNSNGIGDGLEVAYSANMKILPTGWIGMTITWSNYTMNVETSSSVLSVTFDKDNKTLTIKVGGPDGTTGVCNITIPKPVIDDPSDISVFLDNQPLTFTLAQNTTHYSIHMEYNHSMHDLTANFKPIPIEEGGPTGLTIIVWIGIGIGVLIIVIVAIFLVGVKKGKVKIKRVKKKTKESSKKEQSKKK